MNTSEKLFSLFSRSGLYCGSSSLFLLFFSHNLRIPFFSLLHSQSGICSGFTGRFSLSSLFSSFFSSQVALISTSHFCLIYFHKTGQKRFNNLLRSCSRGKEFFDSPC